MRALETWVIVVAAGMGERLGSDRPKAFVKFGERTLVAASLETFEEHDGVDGIVVAVPAGFETDMSLIADDIGAGKIAAAVPGGASRAESVANALQCLPDSAHFVLVHDAARPLVDEALIDRVMHGLADGADGVVPALPVTDTVKRIGPDGAVSETFDRASLRAVQTPQGFPVERLRAAMAAAAGGLADATDCASLVEAVGGRVVCVEGDPRNLKVTTPEDLTRALELAG
jgi:2-C-methyl-D-erythritol 4-phosphate cytidylyltransferase